MPRWYERQKSYHLTPSIDRLTLRLILPEEQERFNDLLIQHHYLHSAGSAGETLRYVALIDGQWVCLLLWGAASYRLRIETAGSMGRDGMRA